MGPVTGAANFCAPCLQCELKLAEAQRFSPSPRNGAFDEEQKRNAVLR